MAIDTEVYDEFQGSDLPTNMLNWLAKDLTKANANRAAVPWVAAYGHKASYMASNSSLWEKLFRDLGVDVYFCGHVHSYTRWLPFDPITKVYDQETIVAAGPNVYTDPKYVVPIVSGSPGCQEVSAERHCLPMDAKGAQNARCGNYVSEEGRGEGGVVISGRMRGRSSARARKRTQLTTTTSPFLRNTRHTRPSP